jgi:WD40-like Beta Propeller Repeat
MSRRLSRAPAVHHHHLPRIASRGGKLCGLTVLAFAVLACAPATNPPPATPVAPHGAWLGLQAPGAAPALFAPGIVDTDLNQRDTAWTPDGRELYYSLVNGGTGTIVRLRQLADGSWSQPAIPAFLGTGPALEPFITADGRWFYFASPRPLPGETEEGDWNLWRAPRTGDDWGQPVPLPASVNGPGDEYYPTLTRRGELVFTAKRDGSLGGEDLYLARADGDGFAAPENLGPQVNSPGPEFNALIAPDGRWILFGSARAGDSGGGDLYISFAAGDGWTPAVALPEPLNSAALDYCPALSPDGSLLFFTSRRVPAGTPRPSTYGELVAQLHTPANGSNNLWWVDAAVLEHLRPGA